MASVRLETAGEGHYRVTGELGFATVADLLTDSWQAFKDEPALDIDLSGVTHSDSAGLALVIEWLRLATLSRKPLRLSNLPKQLLAIARMSNVDDLLLASETVSTAK